MRTRQWYSEGWDLAQVPASNYQTPRRSQRPASRKTRAKSIPADIAAYPIGDVRRRPGATTSCSVAGPSKSSRQTSNNDSVADLVVANADLNTIDVVLGRPAGQRVRIQTREDGVSLDQFVLSAGQYLNAPPGPPKRDATIPPPKP